MFSDPRDPAGPSQGLRLLFRNGGVMLDLMGWATAAVGVAQSGSPVFWLAAVGGLAGLVQLRALIFTGVVELALLAALLTLAPPARVEWVWTAALLVVLGRALTLVWLRLAQQGSAGEG